MTFRRFRLLMEECEEHPEADDILAAVHLKPRRKQARHTDQSPNTGTDGGVLAGMFGLTEPGQTRIIAPSVNAGELPG